MTRIGSCILVVAMAAAAAGDGPATAPSTPVVSAARPSRSAAAQRSRDRYEVLVQRNIFVRGAAGSGRSGGNSRSSLYGLRSRSSAAWVLTGTALLADDRVAFLENSQTGVTPRAHVGQIVEAGRVVRIEPNGVEIEADGRTTPITIGDRLDGEPAPATMPSIEAAPTTAPDAAENTAVKPPTPTASEADILERLRARRAREQSR